MKKEGFRGFFHGLTSTISREMPGYFFFFGGYEGMKTFLTPPNTKPEDIGKIFTIHFPALIKKSLFRTKIIFLVNH